NSQGFMYTANGTISSLVPKNYYKVTAPVLPVTGTEMLTVTAASTDSSGLNPYIKVYDASYSSLASTVINNGNGTFTVQLSGVSAGAVYYLAVSALPGTSQTIGSYTLATQFNNDAATTSTQVANSTLSQSTIIGSQ